MIDNKRKERIRANGRSAEPLGEVTPPRNLNRREIDRKTDEQNGGLLITIIAILGFLGFLVTLLITLLD